jgi:DNA-binding NarL/FixJ family response regulator/tetratricopeptide (TPR) repeat protein
MLGANDENLADRAWLLFVIGMVSRKFSLEEGLRALEVAMSLAETLGDDLILGASKDYHGLMLCARGRITDGLRELDESTEVLQRAGTYEQDAEGIRAVLQPLLPDPGGLRAARANWLAQAGRFDEAIAAGEELIKRIPDGPPQPRFDDFHDAFTGLGQAYAARGRPDDARRAFDRVRAGYSSIELIPWVHFRAEAFWLSMYWLDQPEQRESLWKLVGDAWRGGGGALSPHVLQDYRLELLYYLRGEWDEADEAGRMILKYGIAGVGQAATRIVLGFIHQHRGETALAREHLRLLRADHNIDVCGDAWYQSAVAALGLEAQLALAGGDLDQADVAIARQTAWLDWAGAESGYSGRDLLLAARYRAAADLATAGAHARSALARSLKPRQPLILLRAHRLLAEIQLDIGNVALASEHVSAALELASACAVPFELALTQVVEARAAILGGAGPSAHGPLASAREICERLRVQPTLDRIEDLERQLHSRPPGLKTPGGLSEREVEVLRLVAQGLSDSETAQQLFISRRTVSGHLQSIYSKLGVASRTAAVAFAFENDLV